MCKSIGVIRECEEDGIVGVKTAAMLTNAIDLRSFADFNLADLNNDVYSAIPFCYAQVCNCERPLMYYLSSSVQSA